MSAPVLEAVTLPGYRQWWNYVNEYVLLNDCSVVGHREEHFLVIKPRSSLWWICLVHDGNPPRSIESLRCNIARLSTSD